MNRFLDALNLIAGFVLGTIALAALTFAFALLPDLLVAGWLAALGLILAFTFGASERRIRHQPPSRYERPRLPDQDIDFRTKRARADVAAGRMTGR